MLTVSYNDEWTDSLSFGAFSIPFPLVNCILTAIQYSLTLTNNEKWAENHILSAFSIPVLLVMQFNCNQYSLFITNNDIRAVNLSFCAF